jgi:hypothetical protein
LRKVAFGNIVWKCLESFENDVLMRRPGIGGIPMDKSYEYPSFCDKNSKIKVEPLQTAFHESGREGSVIPIEDHVDGCKSSKRSLFIFGDFRRNDPGPEWIKRSSGENSASPVGIKYKVIKRELICQTLVTECTNE